MLDPSALMREGIESTITSVINVTPTSEEAELLGLVDVVPEGIPSVFSNISDDPFERQEFWRAVERMEATPRSHQIIMEPDIAPAWWREVATTNRLEPKSQNHALQVAEAGQPAPSEQAAAPAVAESETSQPIEPMSIEGLPIVQPTIAPIVSGKEEEPEVQLGTPEGLDPLRPAEIQAPVAGEPEVIISDLDNPMADPVPSLPAAEQPVEAEASESTPVGTKAPEVTAAAEPIAAAPVATPTELPPVAPEVVAATPTPEPDEPKVDRRKKSVDPVLFDLPPQEPPVKPGTSKAAYADFDNLIKKVMDERIPVSSEKQANGTLKFFVPSLTGEQQELLENPRFAHRTN